MSWLRNDHPLLTVSGSLASILSLVLAVAFAPESFSWLVSPLGFLLLIAFLGAALLYLIFLLRRAPKAEDQERLDRIFRLLPRRLLRSIREQDYSIPWKDELIHPISVFSRELGEVEHRFETRRLEKCRRRLRETAEEFLEEEAGAFDFRREGYRYLGMSSGALETASKGERDRFERRRSQIYAASREFIAAHDALVEEAKRQRFDLGELKANPLKPSWTGMAAASSPV